MMGLGIAPNPPPPGAFVAAPVAPPRAIRVISWNALRGNSVALARQIVAGQIDIAVLQETPNQPGDPWYLPLAGLAGYVLQGPFIENEVRHTPTGRQLAPEPSVRRSYAVVTCAATVHLGPPPALVDYGNDQNYVIPGDPFIAAQQGFNLRPPLRVPFDHLHNGVATPCVIYNWHAPIGHWNNVGVALFNGCGRLAQDLATGNPVFIGADMNTNDITQVFNNFEGIQHHVDALLAANIGTPPVYNGGWLAHLVGDAHIAAWAAFDY